MSAGAPAFCARVHSETDCAAAHAFSATPVRRSDLEVIPAFFPPAPGTALPDDVESPEGAEKAKQGGATNATAQEQKEQAPAADEEQKEAVDAAPASNTAELEHAAGTVSAEKPEVEVGTGDAAKASEQA